MVSENRASPGPKEGGKKREVSIVMKGTVRRFKLRKKSGKAQRSIEEMWINIAAALKKN